MNFIHKNTAFEIENKNGNFSINDDPAEIKIDKIDRHTFKVFTGNEHITGYFAEDKDKAYCYLDGEYYEFKKAGEDDLTFDEFEADENTENIRSPMPGSVVELVVKEGDEVSKGAPVIIVEAMKMETTLYSSIDGIIDKINVKKDEQIDADTDLVVIENRPETQDQ